MANPKTLLTVTAIVLVGAFFSGCIADTPVTAVAEHQDDHHPAEAVVGHDPEGLMYAEAGDHADHTGEGANGMERPSFPPSKGSVPTAAVADDFTKLSKLQIFSDEDFSKYSFITGNGTLVDPYVIEHVRVAGDLYLGDTDACVLIRETFVDGQLSLNWNGQCLLVHHNYIRDLRVNENIKRTGFATGGLLEYNKISYIGQLRHYDGEFRQNEVGPFNAGDVFDMVLETVPWMAASDTRVANIDGFNQGSIHHNTFIGSVDLDYHGHHHGTGFFAPHSHYHGDEEGKGMVHDHTDRWTSVNFEYNKIVDEKGYGLRYEDQNHAGDDRTANSESEETLNLDHKHHSFIKMNHNLIEMGQIWVDVFHATDSRHTEQNEGWLEIIGNTVHTYQKEQLDLMLIQLSAQMDTALRLGSIREVDVTIKENNLYYHKVQNAGLTNINLRADEPVAISIDRANIGSVTIEKNYAEGFSVGLQVSRFTEDMELVTINNVYKGAAEEYRTDGSV